MANANSTTNVDYLDTIQMRVHFKAVRHWEAKNPPTAAQRAIGAARLWASDAMWRLRDLIC